MNKITTASSNGNALYLHRVYIEMLGVIPSIKYWNLKEDFNFEEFAEKFNFTLLSKVEHKQDYQTDKTYFNNEDIFIDIDIRKDQPLSFNIYYNISNINKYNEIMEYCIPFEYIKENKKENKIGLILSDGGLYIQDLDLDENPILAQNSYNANVLDKIESLKENIGKTQSGVYLFHGIPGTGKTTFIKYLRQQTEKRFVFMPVNIMANLDSPELLSLFVNNNNIILVVEDCEKLLISREKEYNSAIATLLNLGSGLLGSILNIQIICTFNTDLKNIDEALLRKGRLIEAIEFSALEVDKANALLEELKIDTRTEVPITLAEAYNIEKEGYNAKKRESIGFQKV